MKKIKSMFDVFINISMMISFIVVSLSTIYFFLKLSIMVLIGLITYQPDTIKKYEYIDIDNNIGIARSCSTFRSSPNCSLENGTIILVKQYKEIWIENPKKVK